MTDETTNITSIRNRLNSKSNDTNQIEDTSIKLQEDNWDVIMNDNERTVVQTHGFLSMNHPFGAVFATELSGGQNIVNLVVPWDKLAYFERITEDEQSIMSDGDGGSAS